MEKKVDPGWNDPPMLNYSASNPPPKSRITNKRVAFPLNNNSTTKSQTLSSSNSPVPPIFTPAPTSSSFDQILSPNLPSLNVEAESSTNNSLETAKLSNFIKCEQHKQIFLELWKENKFPSDCKNSIQCLYQYLEQKDKKNVINIKDQLLTYYKDLCDPWITSIEI